MKKYFTLLTIIICIILSGCSANRAGTDANDIGEIPTNGNLIYEETYSPNEKYVEQEERVYNTVRIYQEEDNRITVVATSNSSFFDGLQYKYSCNDKIYASNIAIKWLTITGTQNETKDDQLVVADIAKNTEHILLLVGMKIMSPLSPRIHI